MSPALAGERRPRARIYLVGTMRAVGPGGIDLLPHGRKTRALLAVLCLAEGERVPRTRLVGLLWDRSTDANARTSLRQSLSEINGFVNRHVPGLVEIGRDAVRIDVGKCWVDALAIFEASADATADSSNLVQPYSERLLEDLDGITPSFDHLLAGERTRFEDRVRKILEADLDRVTEQNAKPEVRAAAARRLINFEPTHEGAVRCLMKAFAQMGDRAQAIREFERCRQALLRVLDLPPSRETFALYEAIRNEAPQFLSPTDDDRPTAEQIPPQGAGPHFTFGPAALIALSPPAEIDASGNNVARIQQFLPLARRAADDLIGHLNPNAFPELVRDVADYRAALTAEDKFIVWGIVFGLGVMLENAAAAARREIEDRMQPALEDAAQSALNSLLTLHGPLILATAEGRELSDEADHIRLTRDEQAKLRADAQVIAEALQQDNRVIERPAAALVAKAANAMN